MSAEAAAVAAQDKSHSETLVVVPASASDLRLRLRVPAVLGLIGSCCTVRCCGEALCCVYVVSGDGPERDVVQVQVQGIGGAVDRAWVIHAVASSCE